MIVAEPEAIEWLRQQALLDALAAPQSDATAAAGLRAYRANAHAAAERALAAALPTVQALLGDAAFAQLARAFWHAQPPQRGDLGEWGDGLPEWIEAHAGLAEWPYLADCARLDLALHRCERAGDAVFDAESLGNLSHADPARLVLRLMPGVHVLGSAWPLATIHAAHAAHAANDEHLFAAARERVGQGQGEAVVVARQGWRAGVQPLDAPGLRFMQALAREADLAQALDAAGEGFDFAAWLGQAVRGAWLKEVAIVGD